VTANEIDAAVMKAIEFIAMTQDEYGEFQCTACDRFGNCHVDSTPFITTFVLKSLIGVADPRVDRMRARAIEFLQNEMLPGGLWRYWTFRAPWVPILTPDLDDTATVADILLDAGKLAVDNRGIIRRNMDSRGRFLTWTLASQKGPPFDFDPAANLRISEPRPPFSSYEAAHGQWLFGWMRRNEFPNETDPA
jgi:hypothetical protein